jgi:hypothetical protein
LRQVNFTITDGGPISWTADSDLILVGGFAFGVPVVLITTQPDMTYTSWANQFAQPSSVNEDFWLVMGTGNQFWNVLGWNFEFPKGKTIWLCLDQSTGFATLFFEDSLILS